MVHNPMSAKLVTIGSGIGVANSQRRKVGDIDEGMLDYSVSFGTEVTLADWCKSCDEG